MIIQKKVRIVLLSFFLILMVGGTILISMTGPSLARYEASETKPMQMSFSGESGQMHLNILKENTVTDEQGQSVYEVDFTFSNGEDSVCTYHQTGELSIFATLGLENPSNVAVTLQDGQKKYEGKWTELTEGMRQYPSYGPGWIYEFYDEDGNKLSWEFPGGIQVQREMKVIVSGLTNYHTAFRMISKATPKVVDQNSASFQKVPVTEDVLSGETENPPSVTESPVILQSDLLKDEGQIIFVKDDFTEKTIPVTLYCDPALISGETTGTISVVSNDTTLSAAVDVDEFSMDQGEFKFQILLGKITLPDVEETDQTTQDETAEAITTTETTIPSAEVVVNYGDQVLKATIQLQTEEISGSGTLAYCQSQYESGDEITLQTNPEEGCSLYGFPYGTIYVMDGAQYLLYDVETMILPGAKTVSLLLPSGAEGESITITAQEGTTYTMTQVSLPPLSEQITPFMIGTGGREYPISLNWGNFTPEVKLTHLIKTETGLIWNDTENILWQLGENGLTSLSPVEGVTEPGTYKAIVSWVEKGYILYQKELVFYVQYDNSYDDQGGTGQ